MRRAGVRPDRCHSVDATGLGQKSIQATCRCKLRPVTPYVAGRIASGAKYECTKCKTFLSVSSEITPVAKRRTKRARR
jgi:predicted SprT family Zn-dependent metalloprotease